MTADERALTWNIMAELRRACSCLLSLGLSCTVFWLIWGAGLPGSRSAHRHYAGLVAVFLAILMLAMTSGLRGRLERGAWPIVVGTLFGYFSASLAFIVYLGLVEPGPLMNTLSRLGIGSVVATTFVLPPLVTFSWLLGALTGAFFVLLRQAILRKLPP